MEFDELLITTGVDALVRLVKEKQRIELPVAAQLLNIPFTTIEEWSNVLEEEGIIKIDYSFTKVYISWIAPTEEKVKMETKSFYQEKTGLVNEIEGTRSKLEPELNNLAELKQSFSKFCLVFLPKLDNFERQLKEMNITSDNLSFETQHGEIIKINDHLRILEDSLNSIKSELENTKMDISADQPKKIFEELQGQISSLNQKIADISHRAIISEKQIPADLPSVAEIKKKFEVIKKDFETIRNTNIKMKDDLIEIRESGGVLKEVESSIKKYGEKIADTKMELKELSEAAEELKTKSSSLAEKVKKDMDSLERFSDSIETAKGILYRFPSQEEVGKELSRIKSVEDATQEKISSISKLLNSIPDVKNISEEFANIRKDAEQLDTDLENRLDEIKQSFEESSSSYSAFEKIKERTLLSIQTYHSQLRSIADELAGLKKEKEDALDGIDKASKIYQEKIKKQDIGDVLKAGDEIKNKKEILEQIGSSLESLKEQGDNLSKRLTLLVKEANLLDLRASSANLTNDLEKDKEIVHQLKLTKQEEEDFNRKREELRDLIKKLWEES